MMVSILQLYLVHLETAVHTPLLVGIHLHLRPIREPETLQEQVQPHVIVLAEVFQPLVQKLLLFLQPQHQAEA